MQICAIFVQHKLEITCCTTLQMRRVHVVHFQNLTHQAVNLSHSWEKPANNKPSTAIPKLTKPKSELYVRSTGLLTANNNR